MLICSLIIICILLVFLLVNAKKRQRIEEEKLRVEKENLALKEKSIDELAKYFCNESKKQSEALENLKQWNRYYVNENNNLRAEIRNNQKTLDTLKQEGINSVQKDLARERENQTRIMNLQIEEDKKKKIREFQELNDKLQKVFEENKNEKDEILAELQKEIDDFRARRAVINEQILAERERNEKLDFYKIQLTENDIYEINLINHLKSQFPRPLLLDKLIYDNYIAKPCLEMIKRVLNNREPSGIYKITRLKTNEIYIGKSTNIKNRWQQHCKSVFNCGTISHSILHKTIEKDGIENFTFELLEEVPKEKLSEREKYWIQFYDTVKYGMNEKVG